MKSLYIEEAWDKLDEDYPVINVHDAYVLGEDWQQTIANINKRMRLSWEIEQMEKVVGLDELYERATLLEEAIDLLELPVLGYKYNMPDEVNQEIKLALREKRKELNEVNADIERLRNTVQIETSIFD